MRGKNITIILLKTIALTCFLAIKCKMKNPLPGLRFIEPRKIRVIETNLFY